MLKSLSLNFEVTLVKFLTLLASAALITAQVSSGSCAWLTLEQPKMPRSLIK